MGALWYLCFGLLAVLGRMVGQLLGVRWSLQNSRSELRTNALVDAWRRLARATGGPGPELRQALADVQLVGTPAQVELAARAARAVNELGSDAPSVRELLEALRIELRTEMGLGSARAPLALPVTGLRPARTCHGAPLPVPSPTERSSRFHELRAATHRPGPCNRSAA